MNCKSISCGWTFWCCTEKSFRAAVPRQFAADSLPSKIASKGTWGVLDNNAIMGVLGPQPRICFAPSALVVNQCQYSFRLQCAKKTHFFLRPGNSILIQTIFRALIVNLKSVCLHYPRDTSADDFLFSILNLRTRKKLFWIVPFGLWTDSSSM
jgi:hypothetical protein